MKAYLQIDLKITDLEGFMQYAQRVPALIEKHAGHYLVAGVEPTVIESNGSQVEHSVIIEFPTRIHAEQFLNERASSDLHEIWEQTTTSRILLLEGA